MHGLHTLINSLLYCKLLALELRPHYLKALMRRAQSNEALDKLEEALQGM